MTADRQEYMRQYYRDNPQKWERDESATARRNSLRRKKYAEDAEYRSRMLARTNAYKQNRPLRQTATMYGLSEDELELMLDKGCQVCHASRTADSSVSLHVDHNHSTGTVRGVLCQPCNLALGLLYEDPVRMMAMYRYLMRAETSGSSGVGSTMSRTA